MASPGEQLQLLKASVAVIIPGLAADYSSVGVDHEDALFIRLPGGATSIIQIGDQPLFRLVPEGVRVVDRPCDLHRAKPRRDIECVSIFEREVWDVRSGCCIGFHFQNHPAGRLDRRKARQGGLLKSKLRLLVRPGLTGGGSRVRVTGEEFSLHLLGGLAQFLLLRMTGGNAGKDGGIEVGMGREPTSCFFGVS